MAKTKAIKKKVVCSVLIFVLVMSVIPVYVCATQDQAQIHSFTHTSGTGEPGSSFDSPLTIYKEGSVKNGLSEGESIYYKIWLNKGKTVTLTLKKTGGLLDYPNLDLYLYNPNREEVSASTGENSDEQIVYTPVDEEGYYYIKVVNLRSHLHEVEGFSLDVGVSTPLPPSVWGPSLSPLGTYYLEPSAPGSKIVKGRIGEIRVFGSSDEYRIEIELDTPSVSLDNAELRYIGDYDIPLTFQGTGSVLLLSYDEQAHITPYSIAFYDADGMEVEQGGGWFDSLVSDLIMWGLGKFIPFIPTSTLGTLLESEDEMIVPDILIDDKTYDTKAVIIAPKKGGVKKAVVFIQKYAEGSPDDDTLHLYVTVQCSGCAEGLSIADYNPPTVVGTKYITDVPPEISEEPTSTTFTNAIGMDFVLIPAGEFDMGSPSGEEGTWSAEGPVHHVTIEDPFYIGKYEVTQQQWRAIMGDNLSRFTGDDDLPVEQVSWDDVQDFITKLNEKEGTNKYRMPSEAEWEYACRADTTTRYSFGYSESNLGDYAWYWDNSGFQTHPVGQKKPNPWGLHDMHGNVWEWVQDCWHSDYNGAPADGSAWVVACKKCDGAGRVVRGGGWGYGARYCRSAYRGVGVQGFGYRGHGFRLLREV